VVVDVKKGHLLVLFPQHKANRLDELDAFEQKGDIKELDMIEIVVASHLTPPQPADFVARPEHVDENVKAAQHLKDVVECQKCLELESFAVLHESETSLVVSHLPRGTDDILISLPRSQTEDRQIETRNHN